jgi:N-methyl-L-tryptophan oxidase
MEANDKMSHFDAIVIGAGTMGMAAGYFLAKNRVNTLLIDAFDPPHTNGSHHGDTRIIRHAYGEGRQYVPLVLRAHTLWRELEQECNRRLFHQTGVLSVGMQDSKFIHNVITSAQKFSLPLHVLTADEIHDQWPGISIPDGFVGCLETASGVLLSEECIRAYRRLAVEYGAKLLCNTRVNDITFLQNGVSIRTNEAYYTADKLIVCSGAWSGKIMFSLNLLLQPLRKVVAWFEANETLYNSNVFPAFIFDLKDEHYYGFPSFGGCGIKIGRHDGGQPVDPDQINREFGIYLEDERDVRRFLQSYMPYAAGKLKQGRVCLYTRTPDDHFIIDRHPEYSHVTIAAGFSGHGFKFASVVGEILCDLTIKGHTEHDISMFSIRRPSLKQKIE